MISSNKNILDWVIRRKGHLSVIVRGACMEPIIRENELIEVKRVNTQVKTGDIVLVYCAGIGKLHRIVKIKNENIFTKGDNMESLDENKDPGNIIGVYCGLNEYGRFMAWLSYYECVCSNHKFMCMIFKLLKIRLQKHIMINRMKRR